ncbi:MAG: alpha/beta fold hydrolase [Planctomycetota bacterium]|nr:alpha/beta fold hydrolase [Planctomycetota bacterium]
MPNEPAPPRFDPPRALPAGARPRILPLTLADGYPTYVAAYDAPACPARAPVVYLHGIQSHPAWFASSAAHLAAGGHPVFQIARRGSGANTRDRGHAASAAQLLDDLHRAVDFARDHGAAPRVHLVAVSWGGKLAAAYALDPGRAQALASVTLVAPGLVPQVDLGPIVKARIALCLLCRPRALFDIPLNRADLFTDNRAIRTWLDADPLRLHRATARFLYVSRRLDATRAGAPRGSLAGPTTLLLARRDRIIDNPRTRELVDRLTAGRASVRELDAAHTIEFEDDPADFYGALLDSLSGPRPPHPIDLV